MWFNSKWFISRKANKLFKKWRKMSIFIKELSDNKFEITLNKKPITKHTVLVTDEYYDTLTKKKISKKKLLEYSFQFLLDREPNTSIMSFFSLSILSKYFPEFENEIKNLCTKNWEIEKKFASFVMKKKMYYIVADMKKPLSNEIEYMESGFLSVNIVSRR